MSKFWQAVILAIVAFIVTLLVYPLVLKFAVKHHIYDNPDARKLQRRPVPVMGGVAVWIGVMISIVISFFVMQSGVMVYGLICMTIMLMVGCWDDMSDVSPYIRFLLEVLVVWAMMNLTGASIDSFHGLWGIQEIGSAISIPLSIIAGVGIINAVNLMDGVNGYSSGFGIIACFFFGASFFFSHNFSMGAICIVTAAALVPFYLHNAFGNASRMFIGDGGTLMLGTLLTLCVFCTLSQNAPSVTLEENGISLVAFSLAIMGIPVFDTLRVMSTRIIHKKSPFHPDKTHLHHIFIDCGFSHIGTSTTILFLQLVIVFIGWLSWKLGASIDWQFYIVIAADLLFTFGLYITVKRSRDHRGKLYQFFIYVGRKMRLNEHSIFKFVRRIMDDKFMGVDYHKETDI